MAIAHAIRTYAASEKSSRRPPEARCRWLAHRVAGARFAATHHGTRRFARAVEYPTSARDRSVRPLAALYPISARPQTRRWSAWRRARLQLPRRISETRDRSTGIRLRRSFRPRVVRARALLTPLKSTRISNRRSSTTGIAFRISRDK